MGDGVLKETHIHLADYDVIRIRPDIFNRPEGENYFYQHCCDCGLKHKVFVKFTGKDIELRYVRV